MQRCEILIVGGGPAGATCAWKLHRAGADVLLLDKKPFPRDKTCAGWITPQVLEELQIDTREYAARRVFQPIQGFRTGIIGGAEVETHYDSVVSFGIRRCEFDHYLLGRAGVACRLGEPAKQIERRAESWVVNGEIEARLLVGAGGHFCPVSRHLGARADATDSIVAAQEVEFEAPSAELARGSVAGDMPELLFCRDFKGYGWCFRKGNFLNIGLGRLGLDQHQISGYVSEFCELLRERKKIDCEIPSRFHGHAYQIYDHAVPKYFDESVLLIGDSAGLAYRQSGEGIRPAIESALLAADVILAAGGDYRRERLEPYETRLIARFGPPQTRQRFGWLPVSWLHFAAARLLENRWFTHNVVLDRWFLHRHQQPLALAEAATVSCERICPAAARHPDP
jgi:menaquinone-9 beta-reductase